MPASETEQRQTGIDGDDAVNVAADPEQRRLAEGQDAGNTPDEIQAEGEHAVDQEHRELHDLERADDRRQQRDEERGHPERRELPPTYARRTPQAR